MIFARSSIQFTLIVNQHNLKGNPERHFAVSIKQMAVVNSVSRRRWKAIGHKHHYGLLEQVKLCHYKQKQWNEWKQLISCRTADKKFIYSCWGRKTKYSVSVLSCPLTLSGLINAHFPYDIATRLADNTRQLYCSNQLCTLLLARSCGL
jgi:hypothetical protein